MGQWDWSPGLVSPWTVNQVSKKKSYCLTCVIVRYDTNTWDYIQSHLGVGFVYGVCVCRSVSQLFHVFLEIMALTLLTANMF